MAGAGGAGGVGGSGPVCGNGVVEGNEICDGNCPTSCPDDGNACTTEALVGSAATCDAACSSSMITTCVTGDGCCPAGCSAAQDFDCASCDVKVPADAPTIAAGILAAPSPGTVCIAPGTYTEDLTLRAHVSLQGAGPATKIMGHLSVASMADADPAPAFVRDLSVRAGYLGVVTTCPANDAGCNNNVNLNGATIALSMERVLIDADTAPGTVHCAKFDFFGGSLLFSFRDSTCISDRGIRYYGGFSGAAPQRQELEVVRSRFEKAADLTGIYDSIEFLSTSGASCGAQKTPTGSVVKAIIENNEFFRTTYDGVYLTPCLAMDPADKANSVISIVNNTFVPFDGATGDGAWAIWDNVLPGYAPKRVVANNLYFGTSASLVRGVQPDVSASNLLTATSPFVDVAAGDLHLAPGSPAIDAADPAYAPAVDKDGKPRPVDGNGDGMSKPDVGAHEYAP
jgi:hypothetical protein